MTTQSQRLQGAMAREKDADSKAEAGWFRGARSSYAPPYHRDFPPKVARALQQDNTAVAPRGTTKLGARGTTVVPPNSRLYVTMMLPIKLSRNLPLPAPSFKSDTLTADGTASHRRGYYVAVTSRHRRRKRRVPSRGGERVTIWPRVKTPFRMGAKFEGRRRG